VAYAAAARVDAGRARTRQERLAPFRATAAELDRRGNTMHKLTVIIDNQPHEVEVSAQPHDARANTPSSWMARR
jgi:hypothetical protein